MSTTRPAATGRPYTVEAVLFDFDGTLTRQGAIDFEGIRRAIGIPETSGARGPFILEYIATLSARDRAAAEAVVVEMELEAAARSEPNDGAEEAVAAARAAGLPVGVVTRNALASVALALERFPKLRLADFDVVVTREDDLPIKPAPDALLHAIAVMDAQPEHTMMVGDFRLDVEAGLAAGAITVYLFDEANHGEHPPACDVVIDSLREFPDVLARGLDGKMR